MNSVAQLPSVSDARVCLLLDEATQSDPAVDTHHPAVCRLLKLRALANVAALASRPRARRGSSSAFQCRGRHR
eukprot:scaffold21986_cov30-Tisochrysis_lutea.AAC.2